MTRLQVLRVLLHGEPVGNITRLPGDKNLFSFHEDYLQNPKRPTLSLSFKDAYGEIIPDVKITQTALPPFFSNLLPEGSLRDYLANRAQVKPEREFFLLAALGSDLPGAITVVPDEETHAPGEQQDEEVPVREEKGGEKDILRFSLAGVQLKFSAVEKATGGLTIPATGVGGSWIVKLPSTRFQGVVENEFSMMELARQVKIDVPETRMVNISDIRNLPKGIDYFGDKAFAIRRFDRNSSGERVHMEDFAQIFGLRPKDKYKKINYDIIAETIAIEVGHHGVIEFVRRVVFNALIGNSDMHSKNWSLVYPDRRSAQLAPAYDFVSTINYIFDDSFALNFGGSKRYDGFSRENFVRFAANAKVAANAVMETMEETVDLFAEAWKKEDLPIEKSLKEGIQCHLKDVPIWNGNH